MQLARHVVVVTLVTSNLGTLIQAQENPMVMRQYFPSGTIDGSQNPEQIPDRTAYRLFFRAVSEPSNASPEQRERQCAKLTGANLSASDLSQLVDILGEFYDCRELLEQNYRLAFSRTERSQVTGVSTRFIAERDILTNETRDKIASRLTPEGAARLDRLVQREKVHMILAPVPTMN